MASCRANGAQALHVHTTGGLKLGYSKFSILQSRLWGTDVSLKQIINFVFEESEEQEANPVEWNQCVVGGRSLWPFKRIFLNL